MVVGGNVDCHLPALGSWSDYGVGGPVYYPFDVGSGEVRLSDSKLVKAGVETAEDVDGAVPRSLTRFSFVINEASRMGRDTVEQEGSDALRRYGVPLQPSARRNYIDNWPADPIDPNSFYLMVVTFYEVLNPGAAVYDGRREFKFEGSSVDNSHDEAVLYLPERRIRRVVCRMVIGPTGDLPGTGWMKELLDDIKESIVGALKEPFNKFQGWIMGILQGFISFPGWLMQKGAEATCVGFARVDAIAGGSGAEVAETWVDGDGVVQVNRAVANRNDGIEMCAKASTETVMTCEAGPEYISDDECVRLPGLRLRVTKGEFLPLTDPVEYVSYRASRANPTLFLGSGFNFAELVFDIGDGAKYFVPVPGVDEVYGGAELTDRNRGLTRVRVEPEFLWSGISAQEYDSIDGFVVRVYPDQKSARDIEEGDYWEYFLPRWVKDTEKKAQMVEGFWVGGLGLNDGFGSDVDYGGSDSVWRKVGLKGPVEPVGGRKATSDYRRFNQQVGNLPLAPGFIHRIQMGTYSGVPNDGAIVGPFSEVLTLDGNDAICLFVTPPSGLQELVSLLYDCEFGPEHGAGILPEELQTGLMGLLGNGTCTDLFSSTPPEMTWNNPIVRDVWLLAAIMGGAILFSLMVWQGLRMTFDVWLDPQPAVGMRQFVPRFVLSIVLVSGSLFLCQLILVLATDVTCFVAQMTGMSMWGVIGNTLGRIYAGFFSWFLSFNSAMLVLGLVALVKASFVLLAILMVVVFFFIIVLWLFLKVFFAMAVRVVLLAVLTALSPIAFAMYASDVTAHWTRYWFKLFLGTAFQQVLVLVVIYLGGAMLNDYVGEGSGYGLGTLLMGILLGLMTLYLASKVPEVISPMGGIMSGFGQMIQMGISGAMLAVGGIAGGIAGGAAALGGGGAAGLTSVAAPAAGGGGAAGGGAGGLGAVAPTGGGPAGGPGGGVAGLGPFSGLRGGNFGGGQPSASGGSGASPGGGAGGLMSRLGRGVYEGASGGIRSASGANRRMRDVTSGNFMYQASSSGDDAAIRIQQQSQQASKDAAEHNDLLRSIGRRLGADVGGDQGGQGGQSSGSGRRRRSP